MAEALKKKKEVVQPNPCLFGNCKYQSTYHNITIIFLYFSISLVHMFFRYYCALLAMTSMHTLALEWKSFCLSWLCCERNNPSAASNAVLESCYSYVIAFFVVNRRQRKGESTNGKRILQFPTCKNSSEVFVKSFAAHFLPSPPNPETKVPRFLPYIWKGFSAVGW